MIRVSVVFLALVVMLTGCMTTPEGTAPEPTVTGMEMEPPDQPPEPSAARAYIDGQESWDDDQAAIDHYTRAIEIDPEFALAYFSRAITRNHTGDPGAAIEDLTKAIEIDPGLLQAYLIRGEIRMWELGDESGFEDIIRAYEIDPDDLETALFYAGMVEWDDPGMAAEIYDRLIDLYPDHPEPHIKRAKFLRHHGSVDEALAELAIAAEMADGAPWLLQEIVLLNMVKGDRAAAKQVVNRLLEEHPDSTETMLSAARYYAIKGSVEDAAHFYERYFQGDWWDPGVYLEAAYVAAALGDGDMARDLIWRLVDHSGEEIGAEVARAGIEGLLGNEGAAAEALEPIVQEKDWYPSAWVILATVLSEDAEPGPEVRQRAADIVAGNDKSPGGFWSDHMEMWVYSALYAWRWDLPFVPGLEPPLP